MNYDSYVNNNNDATSTGHCGVHVTLRLVSGTDDELAAQILATLSTTPPAPQSLALLNGHELLKRQLNKRRLEIARMSRLPANGLYKIAVVGMQVGLRWYNTLVQVVVEKMELLLEDIDNTSNATTSNDNSGVDALTLYMNRLNIKSKQMAVITSVVVDKTVQFTMELPQSIQAFEELSIMAQQIYTRLASMVKAMNSLTRLNMKSSPILLITGAVDQQYTQQHIR
ncbi:hypothetical protein BDF19DRAFT_134180 [Syncephalis fuscata]|nr:hypothetical protein BDF19DRAFT_134180 [Syncephalis fuscata]